MATNAIPVTADQKDKPGVQIHKVHVPGVGDVETYIQVVTTDDVDEKTTEGVETYVIALPVEQEEEVEVIGEDGEPERHEDGSTKLKVVKVWRTVHYEVDLSPASREKLTKALAPFTKNARKQTVPIQRAGSREQKLPTGPDASVVRRWAQENNILVDGKPVNEKGRVSQAFIDLYEKAHS